VCNWTWAIICRFGGICEDTTGACISSCWTCCSTPGRRASHREVTIQAKRKLDNMQIKVSCVNVTAFDISMGSIPLSRLFSIKKLHQLL